MSNSDFSTSIQVEQSPAEVFKAVNDIRSWWNQDVEGDTGKLNNVFIYNREGLHYCKMQVTELQPDKKVIWHVLENKFSFTKDQTEWTGTDIIFEISRQNGKTELCFTHKALTPAYECFDICCNAWTSYIQSSLKKLITDGAGEPAKY